MKQISENERQWMMRKIHETQSDELLQRIKLILIEEASADDRFALMTPPQLASLDNELGRAEDDIANGRIHSHEAIGAWISSL